MRDLLDARQMITATADITDDERTILIEARGIAHVLGCWKDSEESVSQLLGQLPVRLVDDIGLRRVGYKKNNAFIYPLERLCDELESPRLQMAFHGLSCSPAQMARQLRRVLRRMRDGMKQFSCCFSQGQAFWYHSADPPAANQLCGECNEFMGEPVSACVQCGATMPPAEPEPAD